MNEDAIRQRLDELRQHPIVREALALLVRELPVSLLYHAAPHTEDVLDEVVRFAMTDHRGARELELLAIAAACHDVGFITSPVSNEPLGAAFARERMEMHGGFTPEEIVLVERMILDTALVPTAAGPRQIASTELSRYLLDADLSNLGRDDFFDKGELQRKELGQDVEIFKRNTLALLTAHRWLTEAGRTLREERKKENVRLLRERLRS
jgi:predicted metal-dependent HD superfamily phosphohydrolase